MFTESGDLGVHIFRGQSSAYYICAKEKNKAGMRGSAVGEGLQGLHSR